MAVQNLADNAAAADVPAAADEAGRPGEHGPDEPDRANQQEAGDEAELDDNDREDEDDDGEEDEEEDEEEGREEDAADANNAGQGEERSYLFYFFACSIKKLFCDAYVSALKHIFYNSCSLGFYCTSVNVGKVMTSWVYG